MKRPKTRVRRPLSLSLFDGGASCCRSRWALSGGSSIFHQLRILEHMETVRRQQMVGGRDCNAGREIKRGGPYINDLLPPLRPCISQIPLHKEKSLHDTNNFPQSLLFIIKMHASVGDFGSQLGHEELRTGVCSLLRHHNPIKWPGKSQPKANGGKERMNE